MIEFNDFVIVDDIKYKINPDYKNLIEIEDVIRDKNLDNKNKIFNSLNKFYLFFDKLEVDSDHLENMARKMIEFYQGEETKYINNKTVSNNTNKLFDYKIDWQMIYSAFYECYGIRLVGFMHWWEFKQLFNSLNSECKFSKIVSYRSYKGKDKDMINLRKIWALPKDKAEEKRQNSIYEKLKNNT